MSAIGIKGTFGEELVHGGSIVLRAAMFQERWFLGSEDLALDEVRCCARVLWDRESPPWMQDFVDVLSHLRVHPEYVLSRVRAPQPVGQRHRWLSPKGQNLWSVLSGWKAAPGLSAGRFDWVMDHARRAFPGQLAAIEFDAGGFPVLFPSGAVDAENSLPAERAADGLLVGLLHLTAVAGAERGAILAFDEPENHLHPYAIRSLLRSMRDRAEERDLTIILTTHSPVVMNEFRHELEQVFVLETSERGAMPSRISDLHNEEWLAQARLGTLYDRLAFGAPPGIPRE
jgi:predicted ATPase